MSQQSSVQFSSVAQSYLTLQLHGPQHARPPCPSPAPGVYPNSCPSSRWCHSAISSSVVPISSCLQSFPASGSFPMSQLFASDHQSIRVSASVLLMNIQDWFPLGLTGWLSLQSKGLSSLLQHHSSKDVCYHSTYCICQSQSIRGKPSRLAYSTDDTVLSLFRKCCLNLELKNDK